MISKNLLNKAIEYIKYSNVTFSVIIINGVIVKKQVVQLYCL